MVIGPDTSHDAKPEEYAEIDALLSAAYGRLDEAALVHRLRADGDMWWEMAKPWQGVIAGYVAVSRMRAPEGWACLCPVAVLPKYQNAADAPDESTRNFYAIGTRLVKEIAYVVRNLQGKHVGGRGVPTAIVTVGKTDFFERAGFSSARARSLVSPYPVDRTLIVRAGDDVPEETLIYPPAFDGLQ